MQYHLTDKNLNFQRIDDFDYFSILRVDQCLLNREIALEPDTDEP